MRQVGTRQNGGQALVILLAIVAGAAVSTAVILGLVLLKNRDKSNSTPRTTPAASSSSIPVYADDENDDLVEEMTDEEWAEYLTAWIDATGGHPDDPQLAKTGALGASDVLLQSLDPQEIAELLQVAREFVEDHDDEPRLMFALGRAAWTHGYDKIGRELLRKAADKGSAAAIAYLGYDALDAGDTATAISMLEKSLAAGFDSQDARLALAELKGFRDDPAGLGLGPAPPFTFNDFAQPKLIQAFYEGRTPEGYSELELLTYTSSFLEGLSDSSNLFMVADARKFYLELDPSLAAYTSYAMMTSEEAMNDGLAIGLESFAGLLQGLSEAGNGSPTAAFAKMNKNMIVPQARIIFMRLTGETDGKRLALSYDYHAAEFKKIYAGIKKYVSGKF